MPSSIFRLLTFVSTTTTVAVAVAVDQLPSDDYNNSISLSFNSTLDARALVCTQPLNAVDPWYYNSKSKGPYDCTIKGDSHGKWSMLNAYRSGGWEGLNWKYTNNELDPKCLENWTYYGKNGKDVLAQIQGRTTKFSDGVRCPSTSRAAWKASSGRTAIVRHRLHDGFMIDPRRRAASMSYWLVRSCVTVL